MKLKSIGGSCGITMSNKRPLPRYVFRYFFDPGSGICLWSDNDTAREKFDYPVELSDLGLSDDLLRQAVDLLAWYDTSIDWSYPSNPSPWPESEVIRFRDASQNLLSVLRLELGPEFEIRDESSLSLARTAPEGA
ncbi:hypothetical protein OYT1_ch0906 [Ferriphaselus amnicola]|uniref:Uncharacterized protein n=1 Tax=Ferriphaselus amnicola TaxID=1188319 RepID=A0A2Z6GAS4_9PROT|nr:hypothetical protein [Ferriphaselus amnicola]BBE50469.1 hypothetical protein OYT1_ch0906 [Ferriphaselus amnicola]